MSGLLRRRTYFGTSEVKSRYDVIVIGGGGHGLATAYYLASRFGVRSVGVFERSYIGAGATGRNTTVLRANQKMPASVALNKKSLEMYEILGSELDYNMLFSRRGILWLAHSEASLRTERERALLNQANSVSTVFVTPSEIKELCPPIDLTCGGKGRPIIGGSYHPPGSVIRHDAVVWGYAAASQRLGVDIHQGVDVTGVTRMNGRCVGVETSAGPVAAERVLCAVGGYIGEVAKLAKLALPITTHPLQAFVTESYRPMLQPHVISSDKLVYINQTSRGEMLLGAEIERYTTYSTRSTYSFLAECCARSIDLLPFLAKLRVRRQWTGLCDMSPDYAPVIGETELENFFVTSGWGTWGFKAIPASGLSMAELLATGKSALIAPFRIDRFYDDHVIAERSSAGTH